MWQGPVCLIAHWAPRDCGDTDRVPITLLTPAAPGLWVCQGHGHTVVGQWGDVASSDVVGPSGSPALACPPDHISPSTRLAISVCPARHGHAGRGPTEPCTGCGRFLLSSRCEWGEYYYRVAHGAGLTPNETHRM